jgi:UDP-2,4-diacetamido-2,4,6-trideoxy-beta-L-altropyranose hydrolase
MNSKYLVIRADSSTAMGTGHVMRCLALAQAWQDQQGEAAFVIADPSSAIQARIESEHCRVLPISCVAGSQEDSTQTIALALEKQAAWVAVDGYQFGAEYQSALKSAGFKVLFLDDYGHARRYEADLILNQNASASANLYAKRAPYSRMLLGSRYCLLRREFSGWRHWEREIPPVGTRVLVTLGGSDPGNLTEQIVNALSKARISGLDAIVVVGGSNPHSNDVQNRVGNKAKISIRKDVTNISELIAWADVAISSAGSTCWEFCFLGLPSLIFDVAENQKPVARELHDRGCAIHLGSPSDFNPDRLADRLAGLLNSQQERQRMSERGRLLVDGRGSERVASLLSCSLKVRKATQDDRELLMTWANDPQVRAASFSSVPITLEEHNKWFAIKMNDPESIILIAENGAGTAVGQFRVDWRSEQEGEIDVSLSPEFRGTGLGRALIQAGVSAVFANRGQHLHAFVKSDNQPSRRAFEHSGFDNLGEEIMHQHRTIHYVRTNGTGAR